MKLNSFILILFITNSIFSQNNSDSLIIKNKVKTVRIYDIMNKLVSSSEFDSLGKLVYRIQDDFGGYKTLKSTLTKIYDKNGYNIISVSTHSNFDKPTVWRHEYDINGNKTGTLDEFGNYVFKYFYDESGFKIKELAYNEEYKIRRKSFFQKFDNGKKVVEKMGNDSIPTRINTTTYDEYGNMLKSESLDGSKVNSIIEYYYENNRLVKTTNYGGYGRKYFYNENGQLIKTQGYREELNKEVSLSYEQFEYNEFGLIEKYFEVKTNENLKSEYRYEYEFYE